MAISLEIIFYPALKKEPNMMTALTKSRKFFCLNKFIDEVCPKSKKKTHQEGSLGNNIK